MIILNILDPEKSKSGLASFIGTWSFRKPSFYRFSNIIWRGKEINHISKSLQLDNFRDRAMSSLAFDSFGVIVYKNQYGQIKRNFNYFKLGYFANILTASVVERFRSFATNPSVAGSNKNIGRTQINFICNKNV